MIGPAKVSHAVRRPRSRVLLVASRNGRRPRGSDDPGGYAKAGVFFDAPGIYRNQER